MKKGLSSFSFFASAKNDAISSRQNPQKKIAIHFPLSATRLKTQNRGIKMMPLLLTSGHILYKHCNHFKLLIVQPFHILYDRIKL